MSETKRTARVHPAEALRDTYVLLKNGNRTIVVGGGIPANTESDTGVLFGGWANRARDTEGDDTHVSFWLSTTVGRLWLIVAIFIWDILLISTELAKVFGWGLREYDQYFTNWSWTLQSIFYTVDLLCYLDGTRYAHFLLLLVGWWTTYMTVVAVFILVHVVIVVDATLFEIMDKQFGLSNTIIGHIYIHILPLVMLLIWLAVRSPEITESMAMVKRQGRLALYIGLNFFYPLVFVAVYMIINNYKKVYHVKLQPGVAVPLLLILYIVLYAISIWIFLPRPNSLSQSISVVKLKHMVL